MKLIIDIGTTNTKLTFFDNNINEIKSFKTHKDDLGIIDINYIWNELKAEIEKNIIKYNQSIKIVFSSAMHTLVLLDENGNELINSTNLLFDNYDYNLQLSTMLTKSGMVMGKHLPIFRFDYFLRNNQIDISKLNKIITLKTYLIWKFTNKFNTELTDASGTGFLNGEILRWDTTLLKYFNLEEIVLPKIVDYNHFETCFILNKKVDMYYGLSDGVATTILATSEIKNSLSVTVGTTTAIRLITDKEIEFKNSAFFNIPINAQFSAVGIASNNGGNVVEDYAKKYKLNLNEELKIIESTLYEEGLYLPLTYNERFDIKFISKDDIEDLKNPESIITAIIQSLCFKIKLFIECIEEATKLNQKYNIVINGGFFKYENMRKLFTKLVQRDVYIYEDEIINLTYRKMIFNEKLESNISSYNYIDDERLYKKYLKWKDQVILK